VRRRLLFGAGLVLLALSSYSYFFPKAARVGPLGHMEAESGVTLVFVPHSDDEVLAAGGLLGDLQAQGAEPRVVLATGGDGFKVGAEMLYRGRVQPRQMLDYGRHRVGETRAALATLGVPAEHLRFLGFPDQGLHRLWVECWQPEKPCTSLSTRANAVPYDEAWRKGAPYTGRELFGQIIDTLREMRPAVVVYPHPNEAHVDHWAMSNFVSAALEELRRTEPDWTPPAEWLYLVHRGDWPAPKGYRPGGSLTPPAGMVRGMTVWREWPLSEASVAKKEEALRQYGSQMMLMRRYLQSFIRTNEVFGTIERVKLGEGDGPYPVYSDAAPPWDGLRWAEVITDPRGDTVARDIERGADVGGVWAAKDERMLYLAAPMAARPRRPVEIRCYARVFRTGHGWSDLVGLTVQPDGSRKVDAWPAGASGAEQVRAEVRGNWVRVSLPLGALGEPESVLVNVETRVEGVLLDRTAWRPISLDGK
jgi:LmbE family N-acetylglucosaminyl deacetylase